MGEKTAQRIIDGRPYESVEDLRRVEGIGEKTLEGIRERICVGD
ncbi:MAG: ComEA family DNA-binding protein [Candidatus Fimadaptatus sp.]